MNSWYICRFWWEMTNSEECWIRYFFLRGHTISGDWVIGNLAHIVKNPTDVNLVQEWTWLVAKHLSDLKKWRKNPGWSWVAGCILLTIHGCICSNACKSSSASKDASCQSSCNCLEPDPMCVRRCIVPIVAFIWLRLADCILFLVFERNSWVLSNSQQVVCEQSESWLPEQLVESEQLVEAPHPNGRNLQKVRCQVLLQWFAKSKGDTSWCTKSRIISHQQPDKWDVRWC